MRVGVKGIVVAIVLVFALAACGHDVKSDPVTEKTIGAEQVVVDSSNLSQDDKAVFDRFVTRLDTGGIKIQKGETVGGPTGVIQAERAAEAADAEQQRQQEAAQQQAQALAAQQAAQEQEAARKAQAELASAVTAQVSPDGKSVTLHNASGQQIYCFEAYIDEKSPGLVPDETKAWFMYHAEDGLGAGNYVNVPIDHVDGADLSRYSPESISRTLVPVSMRLQQYGSSIEAPDVIGHC